MISNEHLAIPPDHPLAQKFYDAIEVQRTLILERNAAHQAGDLARLEIVDSDIDAVGEIIRSMQDEIRRERGGDETCTVGLTYDAGGYPVVDGRPGGPLLN